MNFRGWIAHPGLKLLALLVACVYWVFISAPRREKSVQRSFDVPLALVNVPPELIITTTVRQTVNIRVRGRPPMLRSLSSQNVEAALDLSPISSAGEVSLPILSQSLNIPAEIDVIAIDPPKITLRLEPRRQKNVPIREFLIGQLPTGYTLGTVTVAPQNALVSGPASLIKTLSEVATERIILSGRFSSFERSVGVVSDNPLITVIEPQSAQVSVEVLAPPPATETGEATGMPDASTTTPQ